jgi:hypothetical protein
MPPGQISKENPMKLHRMIASATAVLLLSPAAFAATSSPASCSSLQTQFDKEVLTTTSVHAAKARDLRAEGAQLCTSGKSAEGIKKLDEAIKMLGSNHAS